MGGLPPSSLAAGCLKTSWEESGWPDILKEGLASFINLGSRGGAGGGTEDGKDDKGCGTEAEESRRRGLCVVGGGGKHALVKGRKGVRASGGGGGKSGD